VGSSFNEPGRFRRLSGWRFCRSHLAAAQSSYRSRSCSEFLFVVKRHRKLPPLRHEELPPQG
jgi:hypothetical protein